MRASDFPLPRRIDGEDRKSKDELDDLIAWLRLTSDRAKKECRGHLIELTDDLTALMSTKPSGLTPRGLGLNIGSAAGSKGCSEKTFGHTGSTGTIAWADPATHTICVVLTSLPAPSLQPHPRDLAAKAIAASDW